MFRRSDDAPQDAGSHPERIDSVFSTGLAWQGRVSGTGGLRIEGAFDGDVILRGLVVIGEQGRVTCDQLKAATVIIAGSVKGNITAQRVEISRSGRVWGDVVTSSFSAEEGAFLRGKITMEDDLQLGLEIDETLEADKTGLIEEA
ncbi:MAG: polymer-forming cytoskeletal protein [Anaerolineales bacterium]|jgi:cytoskeletal protein CcmA (bactofilin family)